MANIKYGKQDATDEEVYAAAKKANAHAFISSFPEGYNTQLGETSLAVSGGQKQRIAIARAIIKEPRREYCVSVVSLTMSTYIIIDLMMIFVPLFVLSFAVGRSRESIQPACSSFLSYNNA